MNSNVRYWLLPCLALWLTSCAAPPAVVEKPTGYRIYVTNESSGDLSVIDSNTFEVTSTIPLGKRPRGIHASPDGRTIYVALSGTPPAPPGVDESTLPPPDKSADGIGIFDVQSNKLVKIIQGGSDPENFDISADGKTLFVSNEDASGVSFIDLASAKVTHTIKTGAEPEGVKLTPNGKQVWVTSEEESSVGVVDIASAKLVKKIKVGRRPRTIAFLPGGAHAYVNAENDGTVVLVDTVSQEVIKTIKIGEAGVSKPMGVLLSPDSSMLYVTTGRGHQVSAIDTKSNEVKSWVEVGGRPWGLALSPDGKTLITANGPNNEIAIVDLGTMTLSRKIKCSGSPWGVVALAK